MKSYEKIGAILAIGTPGPCGHCLTGTLATLYDFLENTIRYLAIIPLQGWYFALGQQLPH